RIDSEWTSDPCPGSASCLQSPQPRASWTAPSNPPKLVWRLRLRHGFRQGCDRLHEAAERRAGYARSDLAHPRVAMRNSGVDDRQKAGVDNLAGVYAGRRAAEIHGGEGERAVLAERDVTHGRGVCDSVGGRAANETDDGRRRRHRETAETRGLGDRAVAEVRRRVRDRIARKVEAIDDRRRSREPAAVRSRQLDAEIDAVSRH